MKSALRLLLVLLVLPGVLAADTFPSQERGFAPGKAFQAGDIDHVNLFNGNLVVTLPIGGEYPVGGGLSYRLSLVYNSTVWDFQQGGTNPDLTQALPVRRSNAGMGWRLSLGELRSPNDPDSSCGWCYVGPDGSEHIFYRTLHQDDPEDPGDSGYYNQNVLYTRDGSYLRLKPASTHRDLEFPDGSVHRFDLQGRLISARDPFNNSFSVTYGTGHWKITDTQGRTHWVYWSGGPYYVQRITAVDLQGFGGARSVYSFEYTETPVARACPDNDPETSDSVLVPLLTSVTLPDESAYSMPVSDYYLDRSVHCRLPGVLKGMTLPTLGRLEWTYRSYVFPVDPDARSWWSSSMGVATRTVKDAGNTPLGTWTYTPTLNPIPNTSNPAREAVRTVITPLGDKTEHFFSVALDTGTSGWSRHDYGLPFSRFESAPESASRFRSSKVYDCDVNGAGCLPQRTTWVGYERDPVTSTFQVIQDDTALNRRVATSQTTYHDDGNRYASVTRSDYDGMGHYRVEQTGGNFVSGNVRTRFTEYNPGRSYPAAGYTPWPVASPWLTGLYGFQWEVEGGVTSAVSLAVDPNRGWVSRRRIHRGADGSMSTSDVLVETINDGSGNVASERFYGGDTQTIDVGNIHTIALPATPTYRTDHTYQAGVLATSQYAGMTFKSADRTIDPSTGLVQTSRDSAGLATTYEYDTLGRLTKLLPAAGHDGRTLYTYYRAASPAVLAKVDIQHQNNGGTATLAESRILFDALGRVWKEEQRLPGGWSTRETLYDGLGQKIYVSEQGTPGEGTSFLEYDPFGRPRRVRPADSVSGSHDVTFTYAGVRSVSRTVKVATSATNEVPAVTTEVYDRQGRLTEVTEPNGALTRYEYDVGNRLKKVCQNASGTTCGQTRLFNYDNRGFLLSEQHPEKGASGNGTVSYFDLDARGHARRRVDGLNDLTFAYDAAERLTLVRETGSGFVTCANNGGRRCLKAFTYGDSTAASDLNRGKVTLAQRYNYLTLGTTPYTVRVDESYTYGGRGGRVSYRETSVTANSSTNEKLGQNFTWNELGDLESQKYPRCVAYCSEGVPLRTVSYGYGQGRLTSVAGYGTIGYNATGMVSQVSHVNGVADTYGADPDGMARPSSISSSRSGVEIWNAGGAFQYDGAGNVWKQGSHAFTYDRLSRLTGATLYDGPSATGPAHTQTFGYDVYGNLTSMTTNGTLLNLPAAVATNRLNAGTYDSAGNLTNWSGNIYKYDSLGMMSGYISGAEDWVYVYTADDERLWSYRRGGGGSVWTLRDLEGKVLREYQAHLGWSNFKDYLYRDSQLLAAETAQGVRSYFHLDHLGTVRAITNAAGQRQAYHLYYPYGQELTTFNQDAERMKFTGHERDLASLAGPGDDLDYMHARHYGPVIGRFLSFDPVGGNPRAPQSWNRYGYVLGNPLKYVDPYGLLRQPPAAGMPLENYYVLEGIQAASGLYQMNTADRLSWGALQFGGIVGAAGGGASRMMLSSGDRFLSAIDSDVAQFVGEAVAGFGDVLSMGLTELYREEAGLSNTLETDSLAYRAGQVAGAAHGVALGAASTAKLAAGVEVSFMRYPNAGGVGANLLRNGRRVFGIDWHRFKLGGKLVNRLHYHLGKTASQLGKHRPWQGGWW